MNSFRSIAGFRFNDAYHDTTQHALGEAFEFQLGGGAGIRFLWSDGCAIFIEADYRHISNAGLADRNFGMNAVGGVLGVSWLY